MRKKTKLMASLKSPLWFIRLLLVIIIHTTAAVSSLENPPTSALDMSKRPVTSPPVALQICPIMQDFVTAFDLCRSYRPTWSCANRCGSSNSVSSYVETGNVCSCDESCLVYADCCKDFEKTCPLLYEKGYVTFKGTTFKSMCRNNMKFMVSDLSLTTVNTMGTTHFSTTPSDYIPGKSRLAPWVTNSVGAVLDIKSGFLYEQLYEYKISRDDDSQGIVLPNLIPLFGPLHMTGPMHSFIFPKYLLIPVLNTRPPPVEGVRGCYDSNDIECDDCYNKTTVRLNSLCSESLFKLNREETLSYKEYYAKILFQTSSCRLWGRAGTDFWQERNQLLCHRTRTISNLPGNPAPSGFMMVHLRIKDGICEDEFDCTFSGMPWRRIRCQQLNLLIDQCQVVECSSGYILTRRNVCFRPGTITVKALNESPFSPNGKVRVESCPLCTSLMIKTTLSQLGLWKLSSGTLSQDLCTMEVRSLLDEKEENTENRPVDICRDALMEHRNLLNVQNNTNNSTVYPVTEELIRSTLNRAINSAKSICSDGPTIEIKIKSHVWPKSQIEKQNSDYLIFSYSMSEEMVTSTGAKNREVWLLYVLVLEIVTVSCL